ncbi:MAG TPA: Ig-like domain-containing protein, partial [Bryobacteraceae bacterium]|nr:Ig-like domain-containing protein [Bryobacteraceae bacterium]
VSVSGRPDFFVTSDSGAHAWQVWIPPNAPSETVAVRATTDAGVLALATYNVRSRAETRIQLRKTAGDSQTGAPAAALPQALRIRATDDAGNPVAGLPVRWTASPGAAIFTAEQATNELGEAQARLRMPSGESVALATAEAGRQVTTFSARASRFVLANFPRLTDTMGNDTMLAASASILRYWQNRGELGTSGGTADVAALRQFLKTACGADSSGAQSCDGFVSLPGSSEEFVNLWRLGSFVRASLKVIPVEPDVTAVRDLVAQGTPVLLAVPAGASSRFLAAIGVEPDGRLTVYDAAPGAGIAWDGRIAAAVALAPGETSASGVIVRSADALTITPAAGPCGRGIEWPVSGGVLRQQACASDAYEYQIELAGGISRAQVSDLVSAGQTQIDGGTALTWSITRTGPMLQIAPQTIRFESNSVVNAASFKPGIAPATIAAAYGAGLARAGAETRIEIAGKPAVVLAALPFQVNFVLPEVPPGEHVIRIVSPSGSLERNILIDSQAPAVFMVDARRGAVLNIDGSLNGPTNPARRGSAVSIYGTGFGENDPVVALINGRSVPVTYAGAAPDFMGLTQVNVALPETLPPDLTLPLVLRQAARDTPPIELAVD